MRLTNFQVEDNYAIRSGDTWLDLHNDYDFSGAHYDPASNNLTLTWKRTSQHSDLAEASRLVIWFRHVQFLKMELQQATDVASAETLEFLGFLHPDDCEVMSGCLLQEEADESYHLIVRFENGHTIKCFCDEADCEMS